MRNDVRTLADELRGTLLTSGDPGYDEARRGYNLRYDRLPLVVVRPAGSDDVARAVTFANRNALEIAIRGGGHSLAGYCTTEGGLLLDLSSMDAVAVDPQARLATVEPGATAGQLLAATAAHDLAVPFGDSPKVGVGGITLGGGIGWLSRKYGLTIDSLAGVELVTADGQVVTADERTREDLFWALRGGGGNFGVVTRFTFRLHPVGSVLGGALLLPATPEVVRGVVDLCDAAPPELGMIALVTHVPPLPFAPPETHGRLAVFMTLVWCGDPAEGERHLDALRALARPLADLVKPGPYAAMYDIFAEMPSAVASVTDTFFADELDDKAIGAILGHLDDPGMASPEVLTGVEIRVLGGAISQVPVDATAFAHRRRKVLCSVVAAGFGEADADRHAQWVQSLTGDLHYLAKGAYANFLDAPDGARVHDAYPDATYRRLAEVKRRYDPDNRFHRNLNVPPA